VREAAREVDRVALSAPARCIGMLDDQTDFH
jgi:hypothetical protein